MRNLLLTECGRLRRYRLFWTFVLLTLLAAAFSVWRASLGAQELIASGEKTDLEDFFFLMIPYLGALQACAVSLFLGVEYSDGTLRSKVIAGYPRGIIYVCYFMTSLLISAAVTAAWLIGSLAGLGFFGGFAMGTDYVIGYCLCAFVTSAVFAAIYTMVGTLSANRAVNVVAALLLWVVLIMIGSAINDRLAEPQINEGYAYIDGAFVQEEPTPNPMYIGGTLRTVLTGIQLVLPTCQTILMSNAELLTPFRCALYDIPVAVLLILIGAALFGKKDIR